MRIIQVIGMLSGIIMPLHYTAGVIAPLIAAKLISGTGNIVLAMILCTSVPLVVYGTLITTVRGGNRPAPSS